MFHLPVPFGMGKQENMLDCGALPVKELATLGEQQDWRPRPIYQAHRWFARRFGSAFRGLLVAAQLPASADFWDAYYAGVDYSGKVVLDPFVGGGTSVVEALHLGANVIGVAVDAVARAITRFETRAGDTPDLETSLETLTENVGRQLARYYKTRTADGQIRDVVHYFYVQIVHCGSCNKRIEAHPHYQLAYEAEGDRQWVFCPHCHDVQELDRERKSVRCRQCDCRGAIDDGPAKDGQLTCHHCGHEQRLIDVAERTGSPPTWKLFALEALESDPNGRSVPMSQRRFLAASDYDRRKLAAARRALKARQITTGETPWIPDRQIPAKKRADNRLIDYGYANQHDQAIVKTP